MKNKSFHTSILISFLTLVAQSLYAYNLEGLWHSDREQITIHVEHTQEGFKARRTDQGIWYTYMAQNETRFVDRHGNYYDVWDHDEMAWIEASGGKRILFSRMRHSDDDSRYQHHDGSGAYKDYYPTPYEPWIEERYNDDRTFLEGRWIEHREGRKMDIACFRGGIRIKRGQGGWEKYYPVRYRNTYRDRNGNVLYILSNGDIRWNSGDGRHSRIYHRCR